MYHKAYRIHLVKHQLSISRAHLVWQGESCRIHYISMRGGITMPYATYKRNSQTAQTASKNCVHISTLCIYIIIYIHIHVYRYVLHVHVRLLVEFARHCAIECIYVCCLSVARRYSTDVLSIKAWDVQDFYFLYQHFSIWFIQYIYIRMFFHPHIPRLGSTWFNGTCTGKSRWCEKPWFQP